MKFTLIKQQELLAGLAPYLIEKIQEMQEDLAQTKDVHEQMAFDGFMTYDDAERMLNQRTMYYKPYMWVNLHENIGYAIVTAVSNNEVV